MMKDHFLRRKWNTPVQQVDYQRSGDHYARYGGRYERNGGQYTRASNYRRVVVRTLKPRPVVKPWAFPTFSFPALAACPLLAVSLLVCGALAIAITVGLALIPLYLPSHANSIPSVTAFNQTLNYSIDVNDTLPLGDLSDAERVKLLALLRARLSILQLSNGDIALGAARIVWDYSTIGSNGQPIPRKVLVYTVICTGRNPTIVNNIQSVIQTWVQQVNQIFLNDVFNIFSTTTTTTTIATTITTGSTVTVTLPPTSTGTTSPSTLPTNILSSTTSPSPGRRRRSADLQQSTSQPFVTYED